MEDPAVEFMSVGVNFEWNAMGQFSMFSSSGLCSWFAHNVGTDGHQKCRIKQRSPLNFHLISLELAHHVDQDAAVEHWVAVDRGHVVSDFLLERSVKDGLAILVLATMNESTSG